MNLAEAQIPAPSRATANAAEAAQSKLEPRNQHRPPEASPYLAARREWEKAKAALERARAAAD